MNAKQAAKNRFAKCKQTGIIWPYEYAGFRPPQRYCYIRPLVGEANHLWLAKGYDVATEAEFLKQQSSI